MRVLMYAYLTGQSNWTIHAERSFAPVLNLSPGKKTHARLIQSQPISTQAENPSHVGIGIFINRQRSAPIS